MKYFYTYRVDCTAVGWEDYYYYGQHKTDNLDDGYKGSGTGILQYYKKYPNDYKITILAFYTNKTDLNIAEQNLIGDLWKTDPYCLNRMPGCGGGSSGGFKRVHEVNRGRKLSEEHKKRLSTRNKGKHLSDETKHKLSEVNRGRKLSEETKRKISESHKGKSSGNKGKKQSEIQIQNRINKIKGRKNPNCAVNKGKHRVYREDGTWYFSNEIWVA